MKKSFLFALVSSIALGGCTSIAHNTFNTTGIKKGADIESCYQDNCSVARVVGSKILEKTPSYQYLQLKVLGGEKVFDKATNWNKSSHHLYVTCSRVNPSVRVNDQVIRLPIRPQGISDALQSYMILYMKSCHNYEGDVIKFAQKYNYNVR